MEGFKIEFSDVRLTPEQLKVVEDKIDSLEKESEEAKKVIKRFTFFLEKLSEFIEMNKRDLESVLTSEKDFDIHLTNQISSDRVVLHFRLKQ